MTDKTILSDAHKKAIAQSHTGLKHSMASKEAMKAAWVLRKAKKKKTLGVDASHSSIFTV